MIATGIVRRIDDLGRVVIPKEIRRTLRIKEGDPLELFTTKEGEVIFKKYSYCNEKDWKKAKAIVKTLTDLPFALYNNYGDIQEWTKPTFQSTYDNVDSIIFADGDIVGYICIDGNILKKDFEKIKDVLTKLFSEN